MEGDVSKLNSADVQNLSRKPDKNRLEGCVTCRDKQERNAAFDQCSDKNNTVCDATHKARDLDHNFTDNLKLPLEDLAISRSDSRRDIEIEASSSELFAFSDFETRVYSDEEVQLLLTTLYCYSNILVSLSDENDSDHFRFVKFIKQVELKQQDLIDGCNSEAQNFGIGIAYNFVVTGSYVHLIFTSDSGKNVLIDEISDLALAGAQHVLQLACSALQEDKKLSYTEDVIHKMQRFCLTTVIEQAEKLPNLSSMQKKVMTKLHSLVQRLTDDDSVSSVDSDEFFSDLEDDNDIESAVNEAREFGKVIFDMAASKNHANQDEGKNINNNADDQSHEDEGNGFCASQVGAAAKATTNTTKTKITDMDDLILFTNCNPFTNIGNFYEENGSVLNNFRLSNSSCKELKDAVPECFKVILFLEEKAYQYTNNRLRHETEHVSRSFEVLQQIIGLTESNVGFKKILNELMVEFTDIEAKVMELHESCEQNMRATIHGLAEDQGSNITMAT